MDTDDGSAVEPYIRLHNATSSIFEDKNISVRTVVGITCVLSISGSLLIILSYLIQKNRTKAREILVHISLMDLGVALSNLIGLSVYFDHFYSEGATPPVIIDYFCKIQAFFSMYCTLGSIFWTTALAAYLYIVILHHKNPKYSLYFLRFCCFLCYGLAIGISVWLLFIHKLGYAPYDSSGWCSLIVKDPNSPTQEVDLFVLIFAYDLWIYLAIILIVVFYVAIRSFLSNQLRISKESHNVSAKKFWSSMNSVDYRFIMVPVTFILLRMWTCILGILTEYANVEEDRISTILHILLYLGGIGDSGQGFVNAILFIAFSKAARKSFIRLVCCKRMCGKHPPKMLDPESTTSEEEGEEDSSPSTLKRSLHEGATSPLLYGSLDEDGNFRSVPGEASVNIDAVY